MSISEHYNCQADEEVGGISGLRQTVDDTSSWTRLTHLQYIGLTIAVSRVRNLAQHHLLNNANLRLVRHSVKFTGFIMSNEAYQPYQQPTTVLAEYMSHKNIKELRGFVGLVNQVASFVDDVDLLTSSPPFLIPQRDFIWNEEHQCAFKGTKAIFSIVNDDDIRRPETLHVTSD